VSEEYREDEDSLNRKVLNFHSIHLLLFRLEPRACEPSRT